MVETFKTRITGKKISTGQRASALFTRKPPIFPEEYPPEPKLYGPRRRAEYPRGITAVIAGPPEAPKECLCMPPWNYPPFDAEMFDPAGMATLTTGSPSQILFTYTVPLRHYARLWKFGEGIKGITWDNDTWDQISWEILINGRTLKAHAPSAKFQRGRMFDPIEIYAIAHQRDTIQVWAKTNLSGTYVVYARLMGWTWPM